MYKISRIEVMRIDSKMTAFKIREIKRQRYENFKDLLGGFRKFWNSCDMLDVGKIKIGRNGNLMNIN